MSTLRDVLTRRRQELNPLTTSLSQHPQLPTPQSAVGLSSPFTSNYNQQPMYTPVSAAREYNPQQWNGGPGNSVRYTGPAADPEVPPPYSPPRSNRPTGFSPLSPEEPSPSMLPAAQRTSPAVSNRPAADAATTNFPPPPGGRGQSRDRTQPLFSGFGRRTAPDESARQSPGLTRDAGTPSSSSSSQPSVFAIQPSSFSQRRPMPLAIEPIRVEEPTPVIDVRPPASRRAASTGAIDTPSHSRSRASSTARWAPGMPLPPPPPGPPPQSNSRSQSLSRTPDPVMSPATRRPQMSVSTLGPVPPTPADWVDEDARDLRRPSPNRGLQIDTTNVTPNVAPDPASNSGSAPGSGSGSAGLSRHRPTASRGEPKSIRERRNESRTGRNVTLDTHAEPSNNPWAEAITPSDITVPPMTVLGRRPTITRATPRSGRSFQTSDTPNSARTVGAGTPSLITPNSARTAGQHTPSLASGMESTGSTPRPLTSPFSPDQYNTSATYDPPMIQPRPLPTPPPQSQPNVIHPRVSSHQYTKSIHETIGAPAGSPAQHTPRQPGSSPSSETSSFFRESVQRHNTFARQESAAKTDEERVRLFADFIVTESRLRRQKYATAIDGMGSEILELTRDLFRPYASHQRAASNSFSSDRSSRPGDLGSNRGTPLSSIHPDSRPGSSLSNPAEPSSAGQGRPESAWWNGYMPSLSPIESVSQSQIPDESSSRGRTSSRWWEVGQDGSSSPTKIERSKRESKYMGVPKELRESLQWDDNGQSSLSGTPRGTVAGSSSQQSNAPSEYPSEKVGWHEEGPVLPPTHKTPTSSSFMPYSPAPPMTPNPRHLDVSRLVTLPPPYPRHNPAVNNNHPDLTEIRTQVRALSDFTDVEATKERFKMKDSQLRDEAAAAATQRKTALRGNIQRQISAGTMSYADAAKEEANLQASIQESNKALSKSSFELFQSSVIAPLNDLLMSRIDIASTLFTTLQSQLSVDAQHSDPNKTQEEGDEQPELLEKLTLLKWIFEARETLHKEIYELLSERNDMYKDMVVAPYRLSGNEEKAMNAERFFAQDASKRKLEYEKGALTRTDEFMDTIESNVVQGVEVQLSAFWDIAPALHKVTEKIPEHITRDFRVQIPSEEYEENPGYMDHPLQYLWSLLVHGEKSTYQFIESQINLLCLLHEVKSVVAAAKARVEDAEAETGEADAGGSSDSVISSSDGGAEERERRKRSRREDERRLTDDLKEKVRLVEELWTSALGSEFEAVRARVRDFLVSEGGWEGMEDEE